jgi:type VI protein secretion system component Hcp
MKLSISVLVLMLFLTACNDDRNDVPESEGAAPPEVAASCNPRKRMYMSIQGPDILSTETHSTEEAHRKGWITVLNFEEGEQQVRTIKAIDSSSLALRSALLTGKRYERLTIEVEKGCPTPVIVYQAILTEVILTTIQMNASRGNDRLLESLTWDYMHMEMTHTSINDKGGPGETSSSRKNGRLYWR